MNGEAFYFPSKKIYFVLFASGIDSLDECYIDSTGQNYFLC